MIVASSSYLGKSDVLRNLAEDLTELVHHSLARGASLDEVERSVLRQVLVLGHAAVDMFLQGQGDGDLGEHIATNDGTVLSRSAAPLPRPLRTIFGEHCFQAFVYARGPKQKAELRPVDARLNLPEGKASYLFQEFSQMFCVEKAFAVGAQHLHAVFGQRVSVDVLERINRDLGAQADYFLDSLQPPPAGEEGELLIATADGKGVPLVQQDAEQVPVFDEKERPGNRRMATLGCVYSVDRHPRTPEQIVAALFHEPTASAPARRPKVCGKRYRGYFTLTEPGEEPVPSAFRTWTWLAGEVAARHQAGQPILRLLDGSPSLWEAADACLEEFLDDRGQSGAGGPVIDILDIIHVSGYVWRAAKVFHSHKEHQEAFAYERLLRILRGEVSGVIKGLRRMATEHRLEGRQRRDITTVCNYFEKNAARMRYDEYLREGYPIATGVIEGACRHIITDRMEQGGMRWRLAGAEAMLHVRAVTASGAWEEFG
jgi:hypothetical protein